ncbi:sulfite exporter TauE/SafE family protein [Pectinatus frisingensis]|jgi:uncharacterized membrane protein YfcA|uniref:sulfite exporter TauE/SafE family protein n=1 Tax=Pectinatus frisingensis TaxID=865 RepID=UPI0015F5D2D6|nr:sulfite exporter TauE/SafE family protein [Pectinatus frisingensis]
MLFIAMLLLGMTIGFVGAGGAGVTITLLTVGFGVQIHAALGIALSTMMFTTFSGAVSHLREGNVNLKTGCTVGIGGAIGAFIGANISNYMPSADLKTATAVMMLLSALLLYLRLFHAQYINIFHLRTTFLTGWHFWLLAIITGIFNGVLSGAFGIGAAAFIQLSLLLIFGLSLYQSVGTTMLVIIPISAFGGLGYLIAGHLDLYLFIQTLLGLMIGSFIGAKFTRLVPPSLLKVFMVLMPVLGGLILILCN